MTLNLSPFLIAAPPNSKSSAAMRARYGTPVSGGLSAKGILLSRLPLCVSKAWRRLSPSVPSNASYPRTQSERGTPSSASEFGWPRLFRTRMRDSPISLSMRWCQRIPSKRSKIREVSLASFAWIDRNTGNCTDHNIDQRHQDFGHDLKLARPAEFSGLFTGCFDDGRFDRFPARSQMARNRLAIVGVAVSIAGDRDVAKGKQGVIERHTAGLSQNPCRGAIIDNREPFVGQRLFSQRGVNHDPTAKGGIKDDGRHGPISAAAVGRSMNIGSGNILPHFHPKPRKSGPTQSMDYARGKMA